MREKILIVGATSGMAEALGRLYAARGAGLYLLAREGDRLEALAADLRVRGANVEGWATFEADAFDSHAAILDKAVAILGGLDLAILAQGVLGDQAKAQASAAVSLREIQVTALSVVSFATPIANLMEAQGKGTLAVFSSVAGDRGRQSNYVYGASKALVTAFCSGLRNRLAHRNVHVLTIKPGFIATPMTAHLRQGPLFISADRAAALIARAIDRRKDVAYIPGFWRLIMLVIRHIPEAVFKRLLL